MSLLSWGKPKLETTPSVSGEPGSSASWTELDTPKEDTTQLNVTAGTEVEATEEGGEVIDSRPGKNKYEFVFDLYVKKGVDQPFESTDGIVAGEHCLRVTPEDDTCEGIQIDRCKIRVEENYTAKDGKLYHYVCKCLKPKTGKIIKSYTKSV